MKKRILSTLLCVMLVVALLPTTAFAASEAFECAYCSNVYYGEDSSEFLCDDCGACEECFAEMHCPECLTCYATADWWCEDCKKCIDCVFAYEDHCMNCLACYDGNEDELCGECKECDSCVYICQDCGLCEFCWSDGYGEGDEMHCTICGECYSVVGSAECGGHHCEYCCSYCEQCGAPDTCTADDPSIEYCDECGLCTDCCMENREAYGCEVYCVESEEFEYHFCEDCGECFCDEVPCEYCGLCETCCEANSECIDGMCVEDSDYEEHICPDCGECFHEADQCSECGLCEDCCQKELNEAKVDSCCDAFTCVEQDDFVDHMDTVHGKKIPHTHRFAKSWSMDGTGHWHACLSCENGKTADPDAGGHTADPNTGICTVCGYKNGETMYFITQPEDAHVQVSESHYYGSYTWSNPGPTNYWKNRTSFRVKAFSTGPLYYRWYQVKDGVTTELDDNTTDKGELYVSGATTPTLTISVSTDCCTSNYSYYCVITDGTPRGRVESSRAKMVASHRYSLAAYDRTTESGSIWLKTYYSGDVGWKNRAQTSTGHKWYCCGTGHGTAPVTLNKKAKSHNFESWGTEQGAYTKEALLADNCITFNKYRCTDCYYVKYVEDHECYMLPQQYDASNENAAKKHQLVCTTGGCDKTGSALHTWEFKIDRWPSGSKAGSVHRECTECGYWDADFTWTAIDASGNKRDLYWNTDNILIDVLYGTANCQLAEPGDTVVLTPEPDGEHKFIGWDVNYFYGDDGSEYPVSLTVTEDATSGTWRCTIPADFFDKVPGGGNLYFTGKYGAACTHDCGTTLVGQKDAVCVYDGYTGDYVCNDCGGIVGHGKTISGGEEHTGHLTLVRGTAVEASCSTRGYTGDYECSACGRTISGERTGYAHNNQTVLNYKAATCYEKGYTGDTVCADCGKSLANGKETPKLDHIWDEGEPGTAKRGPISFAAMIYHCTRPGCNGTKTDLLRNAPKSDFTGQITKLDFTMTGYELGNTVGDVDVTMPEDASGSTYTLYKASPLKKTASGVELVTPTISHGHIRNDGKLPLAKTYSFLAEKNYYLVVTVKNADELDIHSKAVATLNGTQSAQYFGEVTINIRNPDGHGIAETRTDTVAVFKLNPLPADTRNVTVKYSEAADSGAGEYGIGRTVTIDAGTKDGYYFSGWTGVTLSDPYSSVTSFTMPDHDVTVIANWTKIGSTPIVPIDPDDPDDPDPIAPDDDYDDYVPSYIITVEDAENGTVSADRRIAEEGEKVTITVDPDKGYELETLTVTRRGKEIKLTDKGDGRYTFKMPAGKVTVTATFMEDNSTTEDNSMLNFFVDVTAEQYYYDAVLWAAKNGITTGTPDSLFDPNGDCTRAQAVTFLWRAAGCPAPQSVQMPFADVTADSFCYDAVRWAVESGITTGTSDTTFSPDMKCDRAQIVTLLHRFAQLLGKDVSVGEDTNILSYADATSIPDYAFAAMQWACGSGVMQGDGVNLMPAKSCTRAQIVTFIYRCMK